MFMLSVSPRAYDDEGQPHCELEMRDRHEKHNIVIH